jgi:hypothetical protein
VKPRIFNPRCVARIKQHSRGDVKALLGTRNHDDLFWDAMHRAHGTEVRSNRLAQRSVSRWFAIPH